MAGIIQIKPAKITNIITSMTINHPHFWRKSNPIEPTSSTRLIIIEAFVANIVCSINPSKTFMLAESKTGEE